MGRFVREREHRSAEDEPLAAVDERVFSLDAIHQALAAEGRAPVGRTQLPRALVDLGVAASAPPPLATSVLKAAVVLFAAAPTCLPSRPGGATGTPASARVPAPGPPPLARSAPNRSRPRSTAACASSPSTRGTWKRSRVRDGRCCPYTRRRSCGKPSSTRSHTATTACMAVRWTSPSGTIGSRFTAPGRCPAISPSTTCAPSTTAAIPASCAF